MPGVTVFSYDLTEKIQLGFIIVQVNHLIMKNKSKVILVLSAKRTKNNKPPAALDPKEKRNVFKIHICCHKRHIKYMFVMSFPFQAYLCHQLFTDQTQTASLISLMTHIKLPIKRISASGVLVQLTGLSRQLVCCRATTEVWV